MNTGGSDLADGSFIRSYGWRNVFSEMFPMIDVLKRQMELMKHTKVSKGSVTAFGQGSQGAESHPQASS